MKSIVATSLLLIASSYAMASSTEKQSLALGTVCLELKQNYGMSEFKKKYLGKEIDKVCDTYNDYIRKSILPHEAKLGVFTVAAREQFSPKEFEQLMIGFAAEFKDGHFNIFRKSRDFYTVGLQTIALGNRLFVAGFNDVFFRPEASLNNRVKVGDEIIEVDGLPIREHIASIEPYITTGTSYYRREWALESMLNVWGGMFLGKKVNHEVKVKFKRVTNGKAITFSGTYYWQNNKIKESVLKKAKIIYPDYIVKRGKEQYTFGSRGTNSVFLQGLKSLYGRSLEYQNLGEQINRVFENDSNSRTQKITRLRAYILDKDGIRIGVLRHPSYSPRTFADIDLELTWLKEVIREFEKSVDIVVLDHLENGGGWNYYGSQFMRLFANPTLEGPWIKLKMNKRTLELARGWDTYKSSDGHLANFSRMSIAEELYTSWEKKLETEDSFFTKLLPFESSEIRNQHTSESIIAKFPNVSLTKPVLLLNSSRSASNGDFIPKILQKNRRAVIFGARSMGLGGPVWYSYNYLPGTALSLRNTQGEIYMTKDGNAPMYDKTTSPIENLGVAPDIYRPYLPSDITDGQRAYANDVLKAAVLLYKGKDLKYIQNKVWNKDRSDNKLFAATQALLDAASEEYLLQKMSREVDIKYLQNLKKIIVEHYIVFGGDRKWIDQFKFHPPFTIVSDDLFLFQFDLNQDHFEIYQRILELYNFTDKDSEVLEALEGLFELAYKESC